MKNWELFAELKNRNARAKELKAQGFSVKLSSSRNQLLHPMYLEDRKAGLSKADCGCGNTIYKTHFSVIYKVEWTPAASHDCWDNAVPYESDGALGHGWECGTCGKFLQAG